MSVFYFLSGVDDLKKDLKTLLPVILEAIGKDGGKVRIYPHGKSMLPMLREGVDSVVLVKPDDVKLYDIVLYRSDDGYSLHRVVKIDGDYLVTCGDNQSVGVRVARQDVIARVESWYRGDKQVENDDVEYVKYIKKIVFVRPFRRIKRKILKK